SQHSRTSLSPMSATVSLTSSLTFSNSSCRAMNVVPLTFQWACLHCVCRSMQSANRALRSSIALARVPSDRPFFVLNIESLLKYAFLVRHHFQAEGGDTKSERTSAESVQTKRLAKVREETAGRSRP